MMGLQLIVLVKWAIGISVWKDKSEKGLDSLRISDTQNFLGLGDHWASWSIFWSLKGGTEVAALCKGGFKVPEEVGRSQVAQRRQEEGIA